MLDPSQILCRDCILSLKGRRNGERRRQSQDQILEEEGIREFPEDITLMSRSELKKHFGAKTTGRMNLSLLCKNLIWQSLGKLRSGEIAPFEGNIRSYWYSHVKPVLARSGGLRSGSDPYGVMIDVFVLLVLKRDLMRYREFGFSDERESDRIVGEKNGHVLLAAEKRGHFPLLKKLHEEFDVTVVALGGHPSLLSTEYFAGEMEAAGFELGGAFPLLTVVDYDPAGWSIVETFIEQLQDLGFGEAVQTDLVLPGDMSKEQIRLNRYRLSRKKSQLKKVEKWISKSGGVDGKAYGLEADAMPGEQLREVFAREVERYLELGVEEIRRRRLKQSLIEVLEKKILLRLATG